MSKILKSLFSLFLGLLLAVAMGELLVAQFLLVDNPPGQFRRHPTRAFEHQPHFKGRDRLANPIVINSMGLRDEEYPLAKPEGVYRIFVLGDSIAFGDGLPAAQAFPDTLERILNEKRPPKVEVLNGGIRGYNTYQESLLLKEVGLKYQPDLVVLAYALNDSEPFSNQAGLIDAKKHGWLLDIKEFVKGHSYLYAFFRKRLEVMRHRVSPQEFAETYDDQFSPDNEGWKSSVAALKDIQVTARQNGASFLMAVFPRLEGLGRGETGPAEKIYEQVVRTGGVLGIDTLGLLPAFKGTDAKDLKITDGDIFHPNAAGHEKTARALASEIRSRYLRSGG
jgi:lysophospholipase L1-like esterase